MSPEGERTDRPRRLFGGLRHAPRFVAYLIWAVVVVVVLYVLVTLIVLIVTGFDLFGTGSDPSPGR